MRPSHSQVSMLIPESLRMMTGPCPCSVGFCARRGSRRVWSGERELDEGAADDLSVGEEPVGEVGVGEGESAADELPGV